MKIIKISALWCPACLIVNKSLKEILKEKNIEIINYDYDMDYEIVEKYDVGKILPVLIFETNKEIKRLIGERTKNEILDAIREVEMHEKNN